MPAYLSPALTPQDEATIMLLDWQADRAKRQALREQTPDEHMERLLADFFGKFPSEREYLETLDLVSKEMGHD